MQPAPWRRLWEKRASRMHPWSWSLATPVPRARIWEAPRCYNVTRVHRDPQANISQSMDEVSVSQTKGFLLSHLLS